MTKQGVGAPRAAEPLLITMPEAALLLRVSKSKAYNMAARGEFPTLKIGRLVRVEPDVLKQWIKQQSA